MARIDDLLEAALKTLPPRPTESASGSEKGRYSEKVSAALAQAFAEELRERGLAGTRPAPPGELGDSGAERRVSGGIGAKKVDVSWATEESGLLFAISIKTINFKDARTGNLQKNLTNRRGDMLFEAVTLHRRFPYSVLAGFFFLDKDAQHDGTDRRNSTFLNAHTRFRLFTGRNDPSGRDEQYERLYVALLDIAPTGATIRAFEAGNPAEPILLSVAFDNLMKVVAERNPDFYDYVDGTLRKVAG